MRPQLLLLPAALFLAACGNKADLPPMVDGAGINLSQADALYSEAKAADEAGKRSKAIKLYDKLADTVPLAPQAPESRFRQAQLLEEDGETLDAFDAYQDLLTRYQGSGLYQQALDRQSTMAFGAADGEIRNSFLGLKSKLSSEKITGMLTKVSDNAPRSPLAAKADFKIGEVYAEKKDTAKAVLAYRGVVEDYPDSPLAPEAQFRIGELLLKEARDGNQDQANLNRARNAFQDYLGQFPNGKRAGEARSLLATLGGQDIQRSYDIAEFYEKKADYNSARFYYQEVLRKAKSGDLHDKAQARLKALDGNG